MEKDTTTYVGLDDSKRKLVVAILRPGEREPEQREMPKEPHLIQRLFRRLTREGTVAACYEAGVSGYDLYRQITRLRRGLSGDRPGVDAAAAGPADQDRSPRRRQAGPALSGGRADGDPRPGRGRGSGPRPARGAGRTCGATSCAGAIGC